MRSAGKLVLLTIGLYISYLNWGYFQERLSSTDYSQTFENVNKNQHESDTQTEEKWRNIIVLNSCMATMCCMISLPFVLLNNGEEAPTKEKLQKRIHPEVSLALPAVSQTLASLFGFLSLHYINYPMLLLWKSSKLMPVMFVSYFLNAKKYSKIQIGSVTLISMGIALFSCIIHPISLLQSHHFQTDDAPIFKTVIGFSFVSINLLMDGFTNAYQDKYRNAQPQTSPFYMMYHINLWQSILLFLYLLLASILSRIAPNNTSIHSELDDAFFFMKKYPSVVNDVICFSLFGAAGQIFIFNIIMSFGSLVSVKICLTRKLFSILLSIAVFGHTVRWWQWIGVIIVFIGLSLNLLDTYKHDKRTVFSVPSKKD